MRLKLRQQRRQKSAVHSACHRAASFVQSAGRIREKAEPFLQGPHSALAKPREAVRRSSMVLNNKANARDVGLSDCGEFDRNAGMCGGNAEKPAIDVGVGLIGTGIAGKDCPPWHRDLMGMPYAL
ncbi:hypothetical protein EYF80_044197 [Liparis tanakae]|uniref:Uncharacterized protein n=1 Tax=Liparis tanakae TaxID=230148 RepID=A0A4Z2FXB1_9TELE|nr:hypothetical protein EYF80_044197 [Liparis tanakae]